MGMGKHIVLKCECGFQTDSAQVGSLLAHEGSFGAFTLLDATYDPGNRRLVTHSITLPRELEDLLAAGATSDQLGEVDRWFDAQRDAIQVEHGPILRVPEDTEPTTIPCPECGERDLVVKAAGDWVA